MRTSKLAVMMKHSKQIKPAARNWRWIVGNRRRMTTVAAAALAVSLGYHVVFGQNGLTAYSQKRQNSLALDLELNRLRHENVRIGSRVEHLQSDPGAIERQAREDLHYARPGEIIIALPAKP